MCRRRNAFFMPKVSPSGGWICSSHNKYNGFGSISGFGSLVFFLFLGSFWAASLLILWVFGRYFGTQKVSAMFDSTNGTQVIPRIPENSWDRGSRFLENYQQDPNWAAKPPEALHIVTKAQWRICIFPLGWPDKASPLFQCCFLISLFGCCFLFRYFNVASNFVVLISVISFFVVSTLFPIFGSSYLRCLRCFLEKTKRIQLANNSHVASINQVYVYTCIYICIL